MKTSKKSFIVSTVAVVVIWGGLFGLQVVDKIQAKFVSFGILGVCDV